MHELVNEYIPTRLGGLLGRRLIALVNAFLNIVIDEICACNALDRLQLRNGVGVSDGGPTVNEFDVLSELLTREENAKFAPSCVTSNGL